MSFRSSRLRRRRHPSHQQYEELQQQDEQRHVHNNEPYHRHQPDQQHGRQRHERRRHTRGRNSSHCLNDETGAVPQQQHTRNSLTGTSNTDAREIIRRIQDLSYVYEYYQGRQRRRRRQPNDGANFYEYFDESASHYWNHSTGDNNYYYEYARYDNESHFGGFVPMMNRACRFLFHCFLLLSTSISSYAIFYCGYAMPRKFVTRQLYFDYSNEQHNYNNTLTAIALVDLTKQNDVSWQAMIEDVTSPYTQRALIPLSSYFIELVLDLPESDSNKQGGMFGIHTEILSMVAKKQPIEQNHNWNEAAKTNTEITKLNRTMKVLAMSRRSSRFPHSSHWITLIEKFCLIVPLLIHSAEESKTVSVFAFRHYFESMEYPLVRTTKTETLCIKISKAQLYSNKFLFFCMISIRLL
jgi:Putative adipose-regulatory protein (Seipin)